MTVVDVRVLTVSKATRPIIRVSTLSGIDKVEGDDGVGGVDLDAKGSSGSLSVRLVFLIPVEGWNVTWLLVMH